MGKRMWCGSKTKQPVTNVFWGMYYSIKLDSRTEEEVGFVSVNSLFQLYELLAILTVLCQMIISDHSC